MPSLLSWIAGFAGKFLGAATLGWLAPLITGVGGAVGTLAQAVAEIILALAKSPEGRGGLFVVALAFGGLYLHHHGAAQARAEERVIAAKNLEQALAKQKLALRCPKPARRRTRR